MIDTSYTISQPVREIGTAAADEQMLSSSELQQNRSAWERVNCQLIEWAIDPSQLEDDGIDVPSREVIDLACKLALSMRDGGSPAPFRVVPDGGGGITFERKEGAIFETIELDEDGSVEILTFLNSRLVFRQRLQ